MLVLCLDKKFKRTRTKLMYFTYLQAVINLEGLLEGIFLDILGGMAEERLVKGLRESACYDRIVETKVVEDVLAAGRGRGQDDVFGVEGVQPADVEGLLSRHCVLCVCDCVNEG